MARLVRLLLLFFFGDATEVEAEGLESRLRAAGIDALVCCEVLVGVASRESSVFDAGVGVSLGIMTVPPVKSVRRGTGQNSILQLLPPSPSRRDPVTAERHSLLESSIR